MRMHFSRFRTAFETSAVREREARARASESERERGRERERVTTIKAVMDMRIYGERYERTNHSFRGE